MNTLLSEFESHLMLGPVDSARILGVSYSNYAAMRSGSRTVQPYIVNHIEAIMLLPADRLAKLMRRRLNVKS